MRKCLGPKDRSIELSRGEDGLTLLKKGQQSFWKEAPRGLDAGRVIGFKGASTGKERCLHARTRARRGKRGVA